MTVSISPTPRKQYLDANGNPLVGGKVFFYAAGSTSKQNTYTTSAGTVANSNPIILDSQGRTPNEVWFTDGLSYKEVLAPSTDTDPPTSGVTMGDNLLGSGASAVTQSEWVSQTVTPTYISATSFSVPGDQTTAFHAGRRILCSLGSSTVYGFIRTSVYTSLTTITVQLDSGALTSGLSAVSLGILSVTNPSIPDVPQVFYSDNAIVNGKFQIAQAGTSFPAIALGAHDLDCWLNNYVTGAVMTIAQDTASVPAGETHSRKVTFTTADASVAATDKILHQTKVEGYNAIKYLNNTFTIGFWVRSSVIGIHCLSLYSGTQSYVTEYTIDTANTWEFKTITIVGGMPSINSNLNAYGIIISWANLMGSNFHATANTWTTGGYFSTSNQVNDAATINNTFYLAGVSMNIGSTYIKPSYDYATELVRCQRYYEAGLYEQLGYIGGANNFGGKVYFKVRKTFSPTVAQTSTYVLNCSATTNNANITADSFTSYRVGSGAGAVQFSESWIAEARI